MRKLSAILVTVVGLCVLHSRGLAQVDTKMATEIVAKANCLESNLQKQTEKYLAKLAKAERKVLRKLQRIDSAMAKSIFGNVDQHYTSLKAILSSTDPAGLQSVYSGRIDSMITALQFINESGLTGPTEKVKNVISHYGSLQEKLNQSELVKKELKRRFEQLKQQLENTPLAKDFRKYQKELYYYRTLINEYRDALENPSKMERKILELALKIPAFKSFFDKNSMLASLFRLPGNDNASAASIAGLQTRASIRQQMNSALGSNPDLTRTMQQSMSSAQSQFNALKKKLSSLGEDGADLDMPDFKPNTERTKKFWRRVDFGFNIQSTRGNNFFPVTSDIGLAAGYKLNPKAEIGIGISYKVGWGQSMRNIKVTHEGIGLRSFFDWKVKGSFYASAGLEYNYQEPFQPLQRPFVLENWQKSGLAGITKIISINNKLLKKTKVQLLWDFLSYQQMPRTEPFKFRLGYSF